MGQAYGQMGAHVQVTQPDLDGLPKANPSAASGSIDTDERIRLLRELASLKAEGILTSEEFDAEKRRILAAPGASGQ